jgi:broad specificity phosphatase PhoE
LNVYLVRHGQAGTRGAYDSLSALGKQQSRLLGEHFLAQGIRFRAAYTGALERQQQTIAEIGGSYADAAVSFAAAGIDSGWNEFDLSRIYSEIAPQMCAQDPEFRREYKEMLDEIRASHGTHTAEIHRKWQPCDTKVVSAWILSEYRYSGETWAQFRGRIEACRLKIDDGQGADNILVVTSAMPIAVWSGLSLEISDERLMRLAGVLYNCSYTVMRLRGRQLRLLTFNAFSHLPAEMRTHR